MSVESYGFKFVVDAKDAAKGYGDFQRAVDGVFSSLQRFEQHAKKVMDSVTASSKRGHSDIAKYAAQFKALANIPIDNSAAPKLLKLGDAMARFRAPNSSQVTNMRNFFRTLGTLPDLSATSRSISNIAKLSAAMNGFKAPSAGQAEKLVLFAKALQQIGPGLASLGRVAGVSGVANELASVSIALRNLKIPSATQAANLQNFARSLQMMRIGGAGGMVPMLQALGHMNGFKAPTQAQSRNLQQFVNAINNLKVPPNAGQIASYLNQIAHAATAANSQLKGFRGSLNSMNWGGFNSGVHKARLEMMGLQNAFSGTFQVGSLLRSLLGSLTIGELGRAFFNAVQAANQFHATMEVLGQSPMMQHEEWERVRADANHFGADLMTFSEGFSKFAVAAHESGMQLNESFKVYEGFQTVMTALHLGQEQQQSVGLAIREIMDQGYVSTQRLTRQLGLVLPGALATLKKAWAESGKPGISLFDALKKKMVDGQWALDTLAKHYKEVYGPAVKAALESPIQQFNILKNNISELMIEIGNDGAKKAFSDFIAKLSGGLDPSHMQAFAKSISDGLVKAIHRAGEAVDWLKSHWDAMKGPLGAIISLMGKWMVVSAAFKIGSAIVSPLLMARRALVGFNSTMVASVASGGRLRMAFSGLTAGLAPLPTGLGRLNLGAMAATGGMNMLRVGMNGVKMAGAGLLNLVGGPMGAAMLGLSVIIGGVTSHLMSARIQMNDMDASVTDALEPIQEANSLLKMMADQSADAAVGVHGVGVASNGATGFIDGAGNSAQTAAQKFSNLAVQARNAMLAMTNQKIMELQQQNIDAKNMTSQGAQSNYRSKLPTYLGGGGKGFDSIKDWASSFGAHVGAQMTHVYDNGESDRGLVSKIAKNNDAIQQLLNYRVRIFTMNDKQLNFISNHGMTEAGDVTKAMYEGSDGGKKKPHKGKKGQSFDSMENDISSMMDKLMDGDPVGKLYAEFVQNLTKEGQTLLNDKSYHTFLENLKNDAANGKVSVEALIQQLEKGGGKKKVLDDIYKRYGIDAKQFIALLRTEQSDYYKNVQEATTKALDAQTKVANDIMRRFAEDDPLLKLNQEYTDDLVNWAQKLLNNASYDKWYAETTKGADGAATATQRLVSALQTAANLNPDAVRGLAAFGKTPGDVVKSVQHSQNVNDVAKDDTSRKMQFGEELLRQGREQLNLATLNDREQSVANKLIEEYNRLRVAGNPPDQAHIDALKQQLLLQEKQLDLLQQQKEYFQNNGIHSYIKDVQSAGEFVHQFDNDFLKGMEDTLYKLGTTGKLSFKGLLDTMQSDIIHFASQGITEKIANILSPGQGGKSDPSIFGGLFAKLGIKGGFTAKPELGADASSAMWVKIAPDGAGLLFGDNSSPLSGGGAGGGDMSLSDLYSGGDPANDPLASIINGGVTDGIDAAQPAITDTFETTFKGLGGSFGSVFDTILSGLTGGGGGGGGGGGMGGLIGMLFGGGGSGGGGGGLLSGLFGGGGGGASSGGMGLDDLFGGDILGGGAGGDMGDLTALLGGAMEGGIVGSFVNQYRVKASAFAGAPHYAEGTPNTSGGHPAILHDNEAVIPLSRGRKVPVDLTGGVSSGNGGTQVVNNFNIQSPDADSFRRSKSQIATDMHVAGARSFQRNVA